jgi:hypothetical protein
MGRLDDPLNTFWQLLFRPAGGASWSNRVESTATATNGGLVLASPGDRSLVVGIRPSVGLTFTPLLSTSDAARSWSEGLITAGLAARPAALATDTGGQALALVGAGDDAEVVTNVGGISSWRTLAGPRTLAPAAPACGLGRLSAVGYLAGHALIGGSCSRPGVVGLFTQRRGTWGLVGLGLPRSLEQGRTEVLGLAAAGSQAATLVAIFSGGGTDLVAAWSGPGARWATSPPLPLAPGQQVGSFGRSNGDGLFVLLQEPSGPARLVVADGPGLAWRHLPPTPPGTETVAFGGGVPAEALAATATVLTVWSLARGRDGWAKSQVIHVPIQFGSSS